MRCAGRAGGTGCEIPVNESVEAVALSGGSVGRAGAGGSLRTGGRGTDGSAPVAITSSGRGGGTGGNVA
jgi:hypothetical protein